jgi:hypothetical protein
MRRLLGHPQAGKFRSQGSIEWPDDQYTRRRLADGSVKRVETAAPKQPEMQPKPTPSRPVDQRRGQPQRVREAVEQVQQKKAEQQQE